MRVIRDRLDTRERSYAYDPNHNRLDALIEGIPEAYSYAPASNRLTAIATPATSRVLSLDAAGNLTDDGAGQTFTYNQAGRLARAETAAGITTYRYNALGLRTHKEGMANGVFHYDTGGRLLAETTPDGHLIRSYVWFGDEPLAQLDGALDAETPTYLHTDHLATPRLGTDQAGIPVWRWESPAFGDAPPSLQLRTVNLRFPGQYFDQETGLHQNWYRDYDPQTGRYVEADPIGILKDYSEPQLQMDYRTGIPIYSPIKNNFSLNHVYGYANQNPLIWTDPFGLEGGQMGRARRYPPSGTSGFGGQIGTTTFGPTGWGQSGSIGVAAWYEECEDKKECGDDGTPFGSPPDSYSGTWYLMGATVRADGTICFMFGLILTWPPISPNWDIPSG